MLVIRDKMLAAATGTFATYAQSNAAAPAPTFGWTNYDRLFDQIDGSITLGEALVFQELQQKSSA
jgi:hypothetical protein